MLSSIVFLLSPLPFMHRCVPLLFSQSVSERRVGGLCGVCYIPWTIKKLEGGGRTRWSWRTWIIVDLGLRCKDSSLWMCEGDGAELPHLPEHQGQKIVQGMQLLKTAASQFKKLYLQGPWPPQNIILFICDKYARGHTQTQSDKWTDKARKKRGGWGREDKRKSDEPAMGGTGISRNLFSD